MNIMTNLNALNASRHLGINSMNYKKTTEKLSSGYKINRAADGAAELGISEQMRSQIRGLRRSVTNAEEGANFIQTGDGSMNEIHAIIQRMRELSVQSLNDTNTPQDRAALAAEFDELQSEIDRISKGTYFNTQPVFQEHEASYYQIAGNRKWAANQQHAIAAPDNSLTVHLPSDIYAPDDTYTIEVPDGIYTTQELIDEIEDAFSRLDNPENPGFVLEFTDEGYCNLNFENPDGGTTKIDSVDGSLAYLIYDCCSGSSNANLLGTTIFSTGSKLNVVQGINDNLSFIVERMDGTPDTTVSLTIPEGSYSREEIIRLINEELANNPDAAGIEAKEYGDSSIQITGGATINITGLKGNMFTIEPPDAESYNSVFYDNISPAVSSGQTARFDGKAYYNDAYTDKIKIERGINDHLSFTFDNNVFDATIPAGDYFIGPLDPNATDKYQNLTWVLHDLLDKSGFGADITVSAKTEGVYISGIGTQSLYYLQLESTSTEKGLSIKPDPSCSAYDTLFRNTTYGYDENPYTSAGSGPSPAVIYGRKPLSGTINTSGGTLTVQVNGTDVNVNVPSGSYTLPQLVQELNNNANGQNFTFGTNGNNLVIRANDTSVTSLGIVKSGNAYDQLFVGTRTDNTYTTLNGTGKEWYQEGNTKPLIKEMASVTMPSDIKFPVSISQTLYFTLNGLNSHISISGTYNDAQALENRLNAAFKNGNYKLEASIKNNKLTLSTVEDRSHKDPTDLSINIDTSYWGSLGGIVSSTTVPYHPNTPSAPSNGTISYIEGCNNADQFTIKGKNSSFHLRFENSSTYDYEITLPEGDYTKANLIQTLQNAIDAKIGSGKINVHEDPNSKCINLYAVDPGLKYIDIQEKETGSFYQVVLSHRSYTNTLNPTSRDSDHTFPDNGAFIIGRTDLVNNTVKITAGMNDTLTVDLNYKASPADPTKDYTLTLSAAIAPEGTYTGAEIAAILQKAFQDQLDANQIDMEAEVRIGGYSTGVANANDLNALQICVKEKTDANGKRVEAPAGTYTLDGVRGSAAYSVFYKTLGKQQPSYVTGVQDLTDGVLFEPGKNEFSFKVDGIEYNYEFPVNTKFTADEFITMLNDKFTTGDINGKTVELKASLENGFLKLTHAKLGPHAITEVSGTAKGVIFYHEEGRENQDPYTLQVGALGHQGLDLTRLRVNTASLGINSVTISRPKYANKALDRLDNALDQLSSRRSLYGALQNRIEFLTSNNRNTAQNLQASESRLRDANMAAELMEHAKNSLTTQASEAVLAQANQVPSTILVMLQEN